MMTIELSLIWPTSSEVSSLCSGGGFHLLCVHVWGGGGGGGRRDGEERGSSHCYFCWRKHIASEAMLMISPIMEYCFAGVKNYMTCLEFRSGGERGGHEELVGGGEGKQSQLLSSIKTHVANTSTKPQSSELRWNS